MSETQGDELALELTGGRRTSDGRTRLAIGGSTALRLGSDPERSTEVVAGLAPLHATVAPIKGGGVGLKVESGRPATLNGAPVVAARLNIGDAVALGDVELRVVAVQQVRRPPLPLVPGYRLEKQLGRGAMGRVYLAVQESLDRKVAIKLLEPELCRDATFVAEFQSEARAAAALHHTNVVTVFDVGEHEGRHYLALEYMDRGSLEDRLVKEGALPWRATLAILRDAAAGLEYAESKGIVHRDIKPANLMQNATGVTKIVDLGLAIAAENAEVGGKIRGTAHFIAPEQARGEALDSRADLYALGASAWRLLTARTPFTGASPREILRAALTEPPPPLEASVPGLPKDVERLVLDLMAKDPADRPANARAVRLRVEALIQRYSKPESTIDAAGESPKNRAPLFAAAAVLVVGAGVSFALFGGGEKDTPRPVPPRPVEPPPAVVDVDPTPIQVVPDPRAAEAPLAGDEDAALRRIEEQAQRQLAAIDVLDDPALVRERLQGIVANFPGTTAATLAAERLAGDSTGQTPEQPTAPTLDVDALRARELAAREAAARSPDGTWRPPQFALRAILDPPTPTALASDDDFAARLAALHLGAEAELRSSAASKLRAIHDEIDAGRFDEGELRLTALGTWLSDAPPAPDAPTSAQEPAPPPPTVHLADLIETVQREVGELPALKTRYELAMAHRDLLARHAELSAGGAFTELLAALDLAGAAKVVAARATLSQDGADWVAAKSQWLRDGAGLAALLRTTFQDGEWRRRSVALPGAKREVREVAAIDDRGLVFDGGGAASVVPLASFGGSTDLLAALVFERLVRDWSPTERRTIAAALVATTEYEGLALARPALAGGAVTPEAAITLAQAIARARAWASPGDSDLVEELAAADVLHALLEALAAGDLGRAAWASDALIERHGRTLLVTCLSNGSSAPKPAPWPPQR